MKETWKLARESVVANYNVKMCTFFFALLVFLCQAGGVLPFAKAPGFPSELLCGKWPIPALGSASNSGTGMCTEPQEQHP